MTDFRFQKYDGAPHWRYAATRIRRDPCGDWFFVPEGTLEFRPGKRWYTLANGLIYLPSDGEWCARIQEPTSMATYEIYVDITHLVKRSNDSIDLIDLDLDVVKHQKSIWIDDKDEFGEHSRTMHYPPDLQSRAWNTSRTIERYVNERIYPFDLSYQQRYANLTKGNHL